MSICGLTVEQDHPNYLDAGDLDSEGTGIDLLHIPRVGNRQLSDHAGKIPRLRNGGADSRNNPMQLPVSRTLPRSWRLTI